MSGAALTPAAPAGRATQATFFTDRIWRAPLVPVALALSAGMLLDRHASPPLAGSLFAAVVALAAWGAAWTGRSPGLPLVYLALAVAALGAAYHHYRRDVIPADDIGQLAGDPPRVVRLRGLLDDEPAARRRADDPLRPVRSAAVQTRAVLQVSECRLRDDWLPVSGQVLLLVGGELPDIHAGDTVEAVGLLGAPTGPANPGERDYAREMRDRGTRAILRVRGGPGGVTRLEAAGAWSPRALRARVRGWGVRSVEDAMPREQSGLAVALLLGVETGLDRDEWDRYKQTGVVHVLVISGQHLVILGLFFWFWLRVFRVRQRHIWN